MKNIINSVLTYGEVTLKYIKKKLKKVISQINEINDTV